MQQLLLTCAILFALLLGGILIDRLYAGFRRRHPELGPFRDNENGCSCCAGRDSCKDSNSCG